LISSLHIYKLTNSKSYLYLCNNHLYFDNKNNNNNSNLKKIHDYNNNK